jgi:acetyl-CoA carboxylase biotin carboxyl carrier protein
VQAGETIGELTVLGVVSRVIAGAGARGAVRTPDKGAIAVDTGWPLVVLDPSAAAGTAASAERGAAAAANAGALTVRAPSSGRFYGRPGPGKPAFVSVGDVIREGHTVCLLEVMKTFHRVTYGGGGLPAEARVTAIAVADEADVNSGDVLLQLEAT